MWWKREEPYIRIAACKLIMHSLVVAVGPTARRHAFGEADEVLYAGQLKPQKYKTCGAHAVYLRDKSEVHVIGNSTAQVEQRAAELRLTLGGEVEYIAGVVYTEGLAKRRAAAVAEAKNEWRR